MVTFHHTQRFPLGTRISKYFNGFSEPFRGTVDQHSDMTDFYHVSYDDGDSEEMTEDDVELHFLELPNAKVSLKASKTQFLELNKARTSPRAPPKKIRVSSESSYNVSSRELLARPIAELDRNSRQNPKVLSLNVNAPGLVRNNTFSGSSTSSDETQESLRVSIPKETFNEEEEGVEEEEEEVFGAEDEEDDDISDGNPEEINQLIGKPVERIVTKEGTGRDVVQGAVASYFPATKMFRVMYFDGECSDLTYHDVLKSIPVDLLPMNISEKKKRKAKVHNGKKDGTSSAKSTSSKRLKTFEVNPNSVAGDKCGGSPSSPSTPIVNVADMSVIDNVEFNIVRKVLYIIVSTTNNSMMEAQLEVLSAAYLKDEEALQAFVQKDGLISLAELISRWEIQVEAEQGLLLVLKILAVLPGITKSAIMDSGIGKKVRVVEKRGTYKDLSIPGLAAWVIQKMKTDVGAGKEDRVQKLKLNDNLDDGLSSQNQRANERRQSTNVSPRGDAELNARRADSKSTVSPRLGNLKAQSVSGDSGIGLYKSKSAKHLHTLMNSRTGRDTSTPRRDRDIFGERLTNQNKRRLGSAQNWRARRSTVVLDQVMKRISEATQKSDIIKPKAMDDDWRPSKISFADKDFVCPFDKEVEVSKLLIYRVPGSTKGLDHPLVKPQTGVLRSILRIRIPPDTPSQSIFEDLNLAPSKVQATERPNFEHIVIPAQATRDEVEDETPESPFCISSRLSKVLSPTEKRKQDTSSSPSSLTSAQTPPEYTEEVNRGNPFGEGEMSAIEQNVDTLLENRNVQSAEAPNTAIPVLSPVVSEDESSDEDEASPKGADDSGREPEATTLTSFATGVMEACTTSYNHFNFDPAHKCV
ncbi:uncharacterized protein PHALS_07690 [Plasmopara halstedii]|uniref:PTM/DIR17-like Tudor domain-containing protein n=1 Tax=Plasmopara halstedii TaxID=4781 RepID=A0A0N7L8I3_PLAHL|nr:uncharacterized protein PHALS_07690 [Plasmopara halstedii]CEG49955.1 hypothetical protein PHALS_07690 [Plasmopara halstedii]|eukprot:XP_024586324.1 hypothetical protein PHALS_07690 [Plasmopara halstedii]